MIHVHFSHRLTNLLTHLGFGHKCGIIIDKFCRTTMTHKTNPIVVHRKCGGTILAPIDVGDYISRAYVASRKTIFLHGQTTTVASEHTYVADHMAFVANRRVDATLANAVMHEKVVH